MPFPFLFEDNENDQVIQDFYIRFPFEYFRYSQLAQNYNQYVSQGQAFWEERDKIGREIFTLIKPFIAKYDTRFVSLIPQRTIN